MYLIGKNVLGSFFRQNKQNILMVFFCRKFDLDGSGTIDKHELKTALSSFGKFGRILMS
jgi:Ca2+-binding EF-hand superfamily protein